MDAHLVVDPSPHGKPPLIPVSGDSVPARTVKLNATRRQLKAATRSDFGSGVGADMARQGRLVQALNPGRQGVSHDANPTHYRPFMGEPLLTPHGRSSLRHRYAAKLPGTLHRVLRAPRSPHNGPPSRRFRARFGRPSWPNSPRTGPLPTNLRLVLSQPRPNPSDVGSEPFLHTAKQHIMLSARNGAQRATCGWGVCIATSLPNKCASLAVER